MDRKKLKAFCTELVPYIDISAVELEELITLTLSDAGRGHYYYLTDNTINFTRLYSDVRPTVDIMISKSDERNSIDFHAYEVGASESLSSVTINLLEPEFNPSDFKDMYYFFVLGIVKQASLDETGTYGERSRLNLFRSRYLDLKNRSLQIEDGLQLR